MQEKQTCRQMQALNNKKARSENSSEEQNTSKRELLTMFFYFFFPQVELQNIGKIYSSELF